jgi:transposase
MGARGDALIRVDTIWLGLEPLDMRAGTESALARVVSAFGAARAHHGYVFLNRRCDRLKVLVCDGIELARVWWRLQLLRRWSHYEDQQIYPRVA